MTKKIVAEAEEFALLEVAAAMIAIRHHNLTPEALVLLLTDEAVDCGCDEEGAEYALAAARLIDTYKLEVRS